MATTRLVVRGRSAHSSTPHLGDNAITRALDLVELRGWRPCSISGGDAANKVPARCELEVAGPVDEAAGVEVVGKGRGAVLPAALVELLVAAAREVRKLSSERPTVDDTFSPPHRTANLGRLEARGLEARLVADVRTLPGEPVGPVRRRFEELAEARRDLGVDVSIERENPALSTPDDAPVVVWSRAVLGALGLPTSLKSKAGCTEAGLYAAAGIPSVVFGPGLSAGNIHAPNEHVPLPQIDRAVEFYSRLIEELCLA